MCVCPQSFQNVSATAFHMGRQNGILLILIRYHQLSTSCLVTIVSTSSADVGSILVSLPTALGGPSNERGIITCQNVLH